MIDVLDISRPVSYTHLDVYKRQMHGNVPEYPEITEQHRNVKKVKQVLRRKEGEYRLRDLSHLRGKPERCV